MTTADAERWNARWRERSDEPAPIAAPRQFASFESEFPTQGAALEIACGRGEAGLWLAARGLHVNAIDVSATAVDLANRRASDAGLDGRFEASVHDLDAGLPDGPPVDVALCLFFRDARLDSALVDRLKPGGLLAIAVLSQVGAEPGRFRAAPGELSRAFFALDVLGQDEADGTAWLLGRRRCGD